MSTDRETTGELSTSSQTIVVTGASGNIGLAIVERLISDGFHVAACCRSKADRIRAAFADLSQITIYELDLRDADSIKSCASAIIKESQDILLGEEFFDMRRTQAKFFDVDRKTVELMASPYVEQSNVPGST